MTRAMPREDASWLVVPQRAERGAEGALDDDEGEDRVDHQEQEAEVVGTQRRLLVGQPVAEAEIAELHQTARPTGQGVADLAFVEEAVHVALHQGLNDDRDGERQQQDVGSLQAQRRRADHDADEDRKYRADPGAVPDRDFKVEAEHRGGVAAEEEDGHLCQGIDAGDAEHQVPLGDHASPDEEQGELPQDVFARAEDRDDDCNGEQDEADRKIEPQVLAAGGGVGATAPVRWRGGYRHTRVTLRRPKTP